MDFFSLFEIIKIILPYIYWYILPYLLLYWVVHCLTSFWLFLIHLKNRNKVSAFLSWIPLIKIYSYANAAKVSLIKYVITPVIVLILLIFISKGIQWNSSLGFLSVILYLVGIGYQMIMWLLLVHWISKSTWNNYVTTIGLYILMPIFLPILWMLFIKNKIFNTRVLWVSYLVIFLICIWSSYYIKEIKLSNNTKIISSNLQDNKVQNNPYDWTCKTIKQWEFNSKYSWKWFLWGFDSKNYFFHISKSRKNDEDIQYIILNGENIIEKYGYDSVSNIYFSDDSNHYAYIATQWKRSILVVDGKEINNSPLYIYNSSFKYLESDYVSTFWVKFSKDWKSVLYTGKKWDKIFFFINSTIISEWFESNNVPEIIYSENFETQVLYKKNKKEDPQDKYSYIYDYYIDNKKVSKFTNKIKWFYLSKNGWSYAFIVKLWKKNILFVNGKKVWVYNSIYNFEYFSDNTYLYVASNNDEVFIINSDWKKWKRYKQIDDIKFSLDRNKYVYRATNKKDNEKDFSKNIEQKWFIVDSNWNEWKRYNDIKWLTYFPKDNKYAYIAEKGPKDLVVINWNEWKQYWRIGSFMFDKISSEVVYIWSNGWEKWGEYLVINEKENWKIDSTEESNYYYQWELLFKWLWAKNVSSLDKQWKIVSTSNNMFSWLVKNSEVSVYAKDYEKYDQWYVSKDRKNGIFVWKKDGLYYIIRNGEQVIVTKDFIWKIYPIDNGNSFIYESQNSWKISSMRTLVKCN